MALANFLACSVIDFCSSMGKVENMSYLVPTRKGKQFLLRPLTCRGDIEGGGGGLLGDSSFTAAVA